MQPEITGRRLAGRYELRGQLGEGGMGIIWQAEDLRLGRPVAIKEIELPPAVSDKQRAFLRARVSREARAAARLNHPGAVIVYDVISENGQDFIIMELVDAPTLTELVHERGPLEPAAAAQLGLGVLATLRAAHEAGIVHRDVKPSNVMVRPDGTTKLADFGVASLRGDPKLTSTGMVMGSPPYMSPEQVKSAEVGPPTDLWSLGATLFFAVEGVPPFGPGPQFQVLDAVIHKPPRRGKRLGPLAPVVGALLDKDPERRPGPDDLRAMLLRVAAGSPKPIALPAPLSETVTVPLAVPATPPPKPVPEPVPAPGAAPPSADGPGGSGQVDQLEGDDHAANGTAVPPTAPPTPLPTLAVPGGTRVDLAPQAQARSKRRGLVVTLLVLLGLVLAGLIGWRLGHGTGASAAAKQRQRGAPVAAKPLVPANWVAWTSPDGTWRVRHPPGWSVARNSNGLIDIAAPDGSRLFRVAVDEDQSDPLTVERGLEAALVGEGSVRHYHQIRIGAITYQQSRAAAWEFTYTGDGTAWHALDIAVLEGGRRYTLLFRTTPAQWSAAIAERNAFFAAFKPLP